MIGFKKKKKTNNTEPNYSQNLLLCKHSYDELINLAEKEFEVNSKLISMKATLNELAIRRDELKKEILEDKKKFMSTSEMEDFSLTEEIVNLQKQYAETQVRFKDEDRAFKERRAEMKSIKNDQNTEKNKISEVINGNLNELSDIELAIPETEISENLQKELAAVDGEGVIDKYINYLNKIKMFNVSELEYNFKKLEILEPLNQMINQDEFISKRIIELRKELNELSDEEFLLNRNIWLEISKLKDKYIDLQEKIINKKEKLKEVELELNDIVSKKEYTLQLLDSVKNDYPEKF